MPALLTVGHGTLDRLALQRLLQDAAVAVVIDVRRYPHSRRNADVGREALEQWLPRAGIDYRWDERLGGRRNLPAGAANVDRWWTVSAFRGYAAHTRSADFVAAWAELAREIKLRQVVIMCSETLWWRCHRRLIADVAVLANQLPVDHLMPTGRRDPHRPAIGARLRADGSIVWDGCDAVPGGVSDQPE